MQFKRKIKKSVWKETSKIEKKKKKKKRNEENRLLVYKVMQRKKMKKEGTIICKDKDIKRKERNLISPNHIHGTTHIKNYIHTHT